MPTPQFLAAQHFPLQAPASILFSSPRAEISPADVFQAASEQIFWKVSAKISWRLELGKGGVCLMQC